MTHQILIKEPTLFFSQRDENHFFTWLESIPAIKSVSGTPNGLEVSTKEKEMDDESLNELIGIMTRYNIDKKCLKVFCTKRNEAWFKNKEKYWYKEIFG